ncbi:MAG: hypothetical protein Q9191_000774 [Dirinaria sp. TL-2023a]
MSTEFWSISEHVIPASHIRGFSRGIRDEQNGRLRLAIKQYTPKARPEPQVGDVTLIMMSGLGASKELYEPFFDELLQRSRLRIRAIWSMDTAHHGASYVLNEGIIGDESNWFDSSRDLFQMINHFQEHMPPPLVAVGSSWGSVSIVSLAVFHPRLFAGIVLMEPAFATTPAIRKIDRTDRDIDRSHRAVTMVKRRDIWPSLADARTRLRRTAHFGAFDPRVFERVVKYDLRAASRERCAEIGSPDAVTLTTPKSMEIGTMMRPDPPLEGYPEAYDLRNRPEEMDTTIIRGFYRGEVVQVFRDLPYILPDTLYVWGSRSLGGSSYAKEIVGRTGTGYGGNGGLASGRVQTTTMNETGHSIPLEKPCEAAETVEPWLRQEIVKWDNEAQERQKQRGFEVALDPEFLQRIAKL